MESCVVVPVAPSTTLAFPLLLVITVQVTQVQVKARQGTTSVRSLFIGRRTTIPEPCWLRWTARGLN